jgi:hypothetical protein
MKYYVRIASVVAFLFFCSCARVPIQAVELSSALQQEANRMHQLNLQLLDKLFADKVHQVNLFIEKEYTPAFIENFKKVVPPDTDFKADFAEIAGAVYPRINAKRDSLIAVLQVQKNVLSQKLDSDYEVYRNAANDLHGLLSSASKVNQQKATVFAQVKELSNNRINLQEVDDAISKFIFTGGKWGANISEGATQLENIIQSLIKK